MNSLLGKEELSSHKTSSRSESENTSFQEYFPSQSDGISFTLELELRKRACQLITEAGLILSLPSGTICTAQILLHRFYCRCSFASHGLIGMSMGAVLLACKAEESLRRLREIVITFQYLKFKYRSPMLYPLARGRDGYHDDDVDGDPSSNFTFPIPSISDPLYYSVREEMLVAELFLLKELGFQMDVYYGYGLLINYCKALNMNPENEDHQQFCQFSWNILEQSHKSILWVIFPLPVIVCSCIFLATALKKCKIPELPPNWSILFDADMKDVVRAASLLKFTMDILEVTNAIPLTIPELQLYLQNGPSKAWETPLLKDLDPSLIYQSLSQYKSIISSKYQLLEDDQKNKKMNKDKDEKRVYNDYSKDEKRIYNDYSKDEKRIYKDYSKDEKRIYNDKRRYDQRKRYNNEKSYDRRRDYDDNEDEDDGRTYYRRDRRYN